MTIHDLTCESDDADLEVHCMGKQKDGKSRRVRREEGH
jgi:hypothetical protein